MTTKTEQTERHEHKGSQCKTKGKICEETSCLHDHHVSRHVEISCRPVAGKSGVYECVHSAR